MYLALSRKAHTATGTIERLGYGYGPVSARNPGIIYCSISGFGSTGPYRELRGYDAVIQAMSGIMVTTGEQDDIGMVPAHAGFNRLTQEPAKATASVRARDDWFTLDRPGRKLAEGRVSGDHYRMLRDKEKHWVLSCDARPILRTPDRRMPKDLFFHTSPDGKRVLWLYREGRRNRVFVDGQWGPAAGPRKGGDILQYHAVGEQDLRFIAQGKLDWKSLLWYTDEDLEAAPPTGELPEGWLPFGAEPKSSNIETGRNSE